MNLDDWFSEFWQCYPADLSHKKKGSKSAAMKALKKLNPDEKQLDHIMISMRELMRHCRNELKLTGKTDRWPFVSTWINQERWTMLEDVSSSELKNRVARKECKCGKEAKWKDLCWDCYEEANPDPWRELRVKKLHELGLVHGGESKGDVIQSCRSYLIQNGLLAKTLGGGKKSFP
jgi:hypothetical protein